MKKNGLTVVVGILLIFYGIINIGSAAGQFTKAKAFSGTTSFAAQMGRMSGDQAGANRFENQASSQSFILYAVAFLILITIVLDFAGAVGIFGGKSWAPAMVIAAALFGIAVEIQDVIEDGFGVFKMIYFIINALALTTAINAREPKNIPLDEAA